MGALRGKSLDPEGKKLGASTGKTSNCGKQSDQWKSSAPTKKSK